MTPDQLAEIRIPSDPRLSPAGDKVAYVVSRPNLEDDRYDRSLWVDDRRYTEGPGDSSPRWSPDGKQLAFLRSEEGKPAQIAVIPLEGGEARLITDFELGVEALEWSPDGGRVVAVVVEWASEWSDLDEDERKRRPRRVTSVPFRFDNKGWTHDRKRHLWLVDVSGKGESERVTEGRFDEESPAWSPDGSTIAFVSDRDPGQGLVSGNDVWEIDIATGEITKVTERGFWTYVSYRSDGVLHLLGNENPRYPVDSYLYRRTDDGRLSDLTGHLDRGSVSLAAGPAALRWDRDSAVLGYEDSGTFGLIQVAPDGSVDTLVDDQMVVTGFDKTGDRLVFTASTWDSPGELFSDQVAATSLNSNSDLELTAPDHFRVDSDGHEIDVWVYMPTGTESVPLLLNIHGGPASQYGFGFFDEFQVYVGAGYGVVACNPRGSAGRGEAFVSAVKGEHWGVVDHADVSAAVAAALERHDRLDPDRMGVMGGSYGGFLTAWIIGHEDRWKSAVVERALISWNSFAGTSDIGGVFPENYLEISYPDAWDTWWQRGPLALAHNVTTPTLVVHAENDLRCPIEQAEQYFMALLRNGTTTEFIRFPDEGHEMSRSGKPRHRQERFEAILDWHDRHLK
ncbi:MAG TPA: S9 family peptidase [Acidimicrobiia bacterium]|nr:S9 family peptidase [Acidimicrobiia bacterium]